MFRCVLPRICTPRVLWLSAHFVKIPRFPETLLPPAALASADRFRGGETFRKNRLTSVVSVGGRGGGDVDNLDQQEPPDFDDALDYDEDETDGLFYRQGDNFIKIWDASAYVDCAAKRAW